MKISIVIPCFNEAETIENIVQAVLDAPLNNKEVIIVDDNSSDGTKEILNNKISPHVEKIIFHEINHEHIVVIYICYTHFITFFFL